jgi:hypothetical protein
MKPADALPADVQARLNAASAETLAAAESAEAAARSLRTLILSHRSSLASESSVLNEIATLFLHATQNFRRAAHQNLNHEPHP